MEGKKIPGEHVYEKFPFPPYPAADVYHCFLADGTFSSKVEALAHVYT